MLYKGLGVFFCFGLHLLFDLHIVKLVGVEDFATELAFYKFDIVFTRYNAHLGMLAGGIHDEGRQRNLPHLQNCNCPAA
jgi:hypothetical protein